MIRSLSASAAGLCLASLGFAQTPAKIDFARDVQPIFRQNCIGCHGPNKQNNGLRVDRRSSVLKPGTRRVMPGSVENSFLYHRLTGNEFGLQMPPTGPLKPDQVQIIKAWIEQGAEWPDALANEVDIPPVNPKAVSLVEALRADRQAFNKMLAENPKLLNERGPEGATPFMYAVLYSDAATLERLIQQGADVNKRSDSGSTALMFAALDLEKTKVLLSHGADVNAHSDDMRTPLMVAAGRPGNSAVVKLLLSKGANVNPGTNPGAESSPILEATMAGDPESMQMLLDRGADLKGIGGFAIGNAVGANCRKCVDMLLARKMEPMDYTIALQFVAVLDNPGLVRTLIDRGAQVNAPDPMGRTALMYAAVSDYLPVEQVRILIEKGADVNGRSQHKQSGDAGLSVLDIARLHGNTPVADLLVKAGATGGTPMASVQPATLRRDNTIPAAVSSSLALLQRTDATFMPKAGCFSCHNNNIAGMAVGLARKRGFPVDERLAAQQRAMNAGALTGARDVLHQGFLIPGLNVNPVIIAFVLLHLDADGYKADLTTDAAAMFIQSHQMSDGHWAGGPESRPPLCADEISQTVLAMRSLQLYAPRVDKAAFAKSIQLAATWIGESQPKTNYDLAWRLQGLVWGGKSKDAIAKARKDLVAVQHPDGGWPDLPSMESGAYTTGIALLALQSSGMAVSDPVYQHGVQYLLSTQNGDGSWHVRTRAAALQPYFDNGFPHGVDQWISAAATGWAAMALTLANPGSPSRSVVGAPPER